MLQASIIVSDNLNVNKVYRFCEMIALVFNNNPKELSW